MHSWPFACPRHPRSGGLVLSPHPNLTSYVSGLPLSRPHKECRSLFQFNINHHPLANLYDDVTRRPSTSRPAVGPPFPVKGFCGDRLVGRLDTAAMGGYCHSLESRLSSYRSPQSALRLPLDRWQSKSSAMENLPSIPAHSMNRSLQQAFRPHSARTSHRLARTRSATSACGSARIVTRSAEVGLGAGFTGGQPGVVRLNRTMSEALLCLALCKRGTGCKIWQHVVRRDLAGSVNESV